ncbi:MAG: hypothetical protein WHS77_02610 [Brevinematales bacterium]
MQVEIETRVARLEDVLTEFISQTSVALQILQKEMLDFKNEVRKEMTDFKNEMREEILALKNEMKTFKDEMLAFKNEMKIFKDEMLAFKNEMKTFKDGVLIFQDSVSSVIDEIKGSINELQISRQEMNKKWGDLARKMGTIAEDIIAPGAPEALMKKFGVDTLDLMVRRKIKDKNKNTEEFDIIILGDDEKVYLIEVKSTPTADYVLDVLDKAKKLKEMVYHDKEIVPIFGSLYIDEDIKKFATKNNIYVIGMKGDYLEILN